MAQETASSLTAKVPPNPQHSSAREQLGELEPFDPSRSARVLEYGGTSLSLRFPSAARARHGSSGADDPGRRSAARPDLKDVVQELAQLARLRPQRRNLGLPGSSSG